jgi:outer membrane protein insertion porin family
MPKKILCLFNFYLVFQLLFTTCLFSAEILQYENLPVEKLEIILHTSVGEVSDNCAITSRISTKEGSFFSQSSFDEDLKLLAQEFDRLEPVVESHNDKITIILNVWPRPTIGTIDWKTSGIISIRRLERELEIKPGIQFDRKAFNTAFHKIKAYFVRKGYFEAIIDYRLDFDTAANQVNITIDIEEGRSGKIKDILFNNFTDTEQCKILSELVTRKYNLFFSWFDNTGIYNEEIIQHDQLVITNFLQNEGYLDAQAMIEAVECSSDRIQLIVSAERGERYFANTIGFEGNTVLSDDTINELFKIRPGDPFSIEKLRATIEIIENEYGRLGYIDAIIDFETEPVEGTTLYNVRIKIEEGQQFRVGMIRIFGNTVTQTNVILHETILVPGDIFNIIKMKATEIRLMNIGYFKNVNVYMVKGADASGLGSNYRDVYVEVEETTTGNFSMFFGYSSVEELFGGFQLSENNFNYRGFSQIHSKGPQALRGGGESASLTANIGQKSTTYTLSWSKPFFLDTKWTIGVDLAKTSTRYISEEYDLHSTTLNLRGSYRINEFVRMGVHYRIKNGVVALHNIKKEQRHHHHAIEELRREARIHGLISAVGTSLNYDSTDRFEKATKGFRSGLLAECAGVGGDHAFLSFGYLNSYYFPVGSRLVIKYRADWKFLKPLGNTDYATMPLDERLFLGGDYDVRGYRPYRIGPQYGHSHIPRGGLSMQLYSIEMSRRIWGDWDLFAFMDAGHLSKKTWEFGHLSTSIGYGMRFKLPIASIPPMTIGMGYPLNAKNRSEVKKFFINFGASF